MEKQTFINQTTARGYELETVGNGNVTATKGDITYDWYHSPTTLSTSTRRPRPQ